MSYRVTIVDAYDSFVHILAAYFETLGCQVAVVRKDSPELRSKLDPRVTDVVVLGPGPGHPSHSGYKAIIDCSIGKLPILGVCLGHQAIGLYFDCKLGYAKHLMHGKTSKIIHDGFGCFNSFNKNAFNAMRYHSIVVEDDGFNNEHLVVSARSEDDNYIMGIRHKHLAIEGVQFHPESIGTDSGLSILKNFLDVHFNG